MLQAANGEKEALEAGCLGDPMFEILSMNEQGKNTKLYSAILVRELTILLAMSDCQLEFVQCELSKIIDAVHGSVLRARHCRRPCKRGVKRKLKRGVKRKLK